jgi:cytochrome c-type biogenesis protein CcmH
MSVDVQTLRAQLLQLDQLHASGTLSAEQYTESKTRLERRVLDLVMAGAPAAPVAAVATARPSKRLIGIAAAFAVLVAGGGYAFYGAPAFFGMGPSSTLAQGAGPGAGDAAAADPAAAASGPQHTMGVDQIAAMVDRLAARMKENPNDGEGWTMLARSYTVLGRHAEALPAYQKALALHVEDPSLLADYADSMAVANKGQIEGEPLKLVERALKMDPDHTKALSLAGSAAFERKDYATAVKHWERIITAGKANPELIQQVQSSVAEARQLGGMPASTAQPPAAPMAPAATTGMAPAAKPQAAAPAAAAGAFVAGKVTITAAMLGKASPEDSVFIFARAAEGPRMPLAALRKQVKDLPVTFKLDDSMGMTPQMKLSSFDKVVVGARISKSGNPIAQPGDLQGSSAPVALGSSDLKIEINQVVGQ